MRICEEIKNENKTKEKRLEITNREETREEEDIYKAEMGSRCPKDTCHHFYNPLGRIPRALKLQTALDSSSGL